MQTKPFLHRLAIVAHLLLAPCLLAQTNSWINPASGKWENTNSWSLNTLPASSQTIEITNDGTKVVTIDQTTAQVASNSMNVSSIDLSANNSLVLTNFGTNIP